MRTSFELALVALSAGLIFAFARPTPAALGELTTPGVALPADFPKEARSKIDKALTRPDCKFLGGNWLNSHTSLRYGGETKALNLFMDDLAKCPGVTVHVALRKLTDVDADWRVSHDAFTGFQVEVNLLSKRIDLEQLYIPEAKGPPVGGVERK